MPGTSPGMTTKGETPEVAHNAPILTRIVGTRPLNARTGQQWAWPDHDVRDGAAIRLEIYNSARLSTG